MLQYYVNDYHFPTETLIPEVWEDLILRYGRGKRERQAIYDLNTQPKIYRGNEVDAPCILTSCNLSNIHCNLSHVNFVSSEGLGNKEAAPSLSVCCRSITSLSNGINHVFMNAPMNEVTIIKSKSAQTCRNAQKNAKSVDPWYIRM